MSMSALGNQLSALASSKSTSAGFVHSTSRANNDGIGRGFHHSNRHGYSTGNSDAVGGADDVTRVPSVLFENAREAAEVTVATLRENAVNAWESLTRDVVVNNNNNNIANSESNSDGDGDDAAALFSIHNLENFERGTSTSQRNLQVDESIEKALSLIMTMTAEHPPSSINNDDINSNPILLSCLHVIEYLLRKYRIHSRPSTASALLSAFLPLQMAHPTAYPRLFGRVLALIDLQDVPHWTFARMYAARDAPPLSRGVLAKHVARDEALAIAMVSMAKKATEIGLSEEGGINNSNNNNGGGARSRRGISAILSATASVLTEALYLQSTNKTNGPDAGAREGTVRALFPSILSACKSDATGERKEWGRILASTIAGLCPLSAEARVALCDAIADGMPAVADGREALSGREADDATSGVMTLLSVLGSMGDGDGDDAGNEDGWERYLPMLPPSKKRNGTKRKKKRTVVDCLGCELPSSTYRRLVGKDNVASMAMGAVLRSTNAEDADGNAFVEERMAPLAASLIMHAFQNMEKEAREAFEGDAVSTPSKKKKKKKGGDGNAERDVQLILNLMSGSFRYQILFYWILECWSELLHRVYFLYRSMSKLGCLVCASMHFNMDAEESVLGSCFSTYTTFHMSIYQCCSSTDVCSEVLSALFKYSSQEEGLVL